MDIDSYQEKIISKVREDINNLKNQKINSSKSALAYYALWGSNVGFEKLKFKIFGITRLYSLIKFYLKDAISVLNNMDFQFNAEFKNFKQKKLFISIAHKKDFNKNGSFTDRYFKINSKNYKDFLFILIYLDKDIPREIDENIFIYYKKKSSFARNLFFFLKLYIKKIILFPPLSKKIIHELSYQSIYAEIFFDKIKTNINFKKIDFIFMPYEGQPFQQFIFQESKKINKNIINYGYEHSAPHSIPIHLYYRNGAPDILFVNGKSQIKHLTTYMGWPIESLKLVPTLRYQSINYDDFSNYLFLPYEIFDEKLILKELENYLKNLKNNSLNKINVKIHPVAPNIDSQKNIKLKIEKLFDKYSYKFSRSRIDNDISIFVGPTTGVIVALEKSLKVLHICFDPIFDSYSETLWPELSVKKVSNNTLEYFLKKKEEFLLFKKEENIFEKYYN